MVAKQSVRSFPDKKSKIRSSNSTLYSIVHALCADLIRILYMYKKNSHTDPRSKRFNFTFTMRDSPTDYINVTCWGTEPYIQMTFENFRMCDVGASLEIAVVHYVLNVIAVLKEIFLSFGC